MFNNTVFKWFWTIFSLGAPAFLCKSLIYWFRTTRFISTPKRHAIVSVLLKQAARNVGDTCIYRCEKQTFLRENIVLFCDCNKFILKKSHNPLSKSTIVYYLLRIKRAVILEKKYVAFSSGGQTKVSVIKECSPSGDPLYTKNCTLLV